MSDTSRPPRVPLAPLSFDGPLGRQIVELHMWAVREGLRGAAAAALFDGFCQRLVIAGVPLWRAFAGMRTLHPQWGGYSYTWRRDLNAIEPAQFDRGNEYEQILLNSPFGYLIRQVETSGQEADPWQHLRRRLAGPEAQLDFPFSRSSPPPAQPIIWPRSSASVRTGTLPMAPASAIRSRPTGPGASATMTSYCCGPCCLPYPSR